MAEDNSINNMLNLAGSSSPKLSWIYTTGDVISSSATVADGVIYFGSWDHTLYALNVVTGNKLWSYTTKDRIFASPTVTKNIVYIGSWDHNLYALDAKTGAKLWSYSTGSIISSSPTVVNGMVYIGSNNHNLYAFTLMHLVHQRAVQSGRFEDMTFDDNKWNTNGERNGRAF